MKIEVTISEEVKTIDEFLDAIARENSKFTVWKQSEEIVTLHFNNPWYGSNTSYLVKGIIDKSVLNTLSPSIKLKGTIAYRIGQYFLIAFFAFMLIPPLWDFDLVWAGLTLVMLFLFLGFYQLMYKIGEGIFYGNFYDEINDGKKPLKDL